MMVTLEELKTWTTRGTLFLDSEDHYENHYVCVEEPRLTIVTSGPSGMLRRRRKPPTGHSIRYLVDGEPCKDLADVVTRLNQPPPAESKECPESPPSGTGASS